MTPDCAEVQRNGRIPRLPTLAPPRMSIRTYILALARIIHEGARPKAGRGRTAVRAMKCPADLPAMARAAVRNGVRLPPNRVSGRRGPAVAAAKTIGFVSSGGLRQGPVWPGVLRGRERRRQSEIRAAGGPESVAPTGLRGLPP